MDKEEAIKLYNTKWWLNKTDIEIAEFQLNEPTLCCPFDIFHRAVTTYMGRPVFTHEFADLQALIDEHNGKREYDGIIDSLKRVAPGKPIVIIRNKE